MVWRRAAAIFAAAAVLCGVAVDELPAEADTGFSFAAAPAGAASGATGGAGRPQAVVTTLADSGPGSLRAALDANAGLIRFESGLTGDITALAPFQVQSDTTIDGRGADVTVRDFGFVIDRAWNVIIRNLKLRHIKDDGVSVSRSSRIWLDHLDIANDGETNFDGAIDAVLNSTAVTISWTKIAGHEKALLLGAGTASGTPDLVDMTLHHNHLTGNLARNPAIRHGRFLMVNNVISGWGNGPKHGYGTRSGCGSQALLIANVFRPATNMHGVQTAEAGCDPSRPPATALSDNAAGGAVLQAALAETVPDLLTGSGLSPEAAGDALEATVQSAAGWQDVPYDATDESAPAKPPVLAPVLAPLSNTGLNLSWTAFPDAIKYGWRISTCDGSVVVVSETAVTSKPQSPLGSGCYVGAVRYITPGGRSSWETSNDVHLAGPPVTTTSTTSTTGTTSTTSTTSTTTTLPPTTTTLPPTTTTLPPTTTTLPPTTTTLPPTTTTTMATPTGTTTPPPPPPPDDMIWLTKAWVGALDITWHPVPGATKYYWWLRTCSGTLIVESSTTFTTKRKTGLPNGCYVGSVQPVTTARQAVYTSVPFELT